MNDQKTPYEYGHEAFRNGKMCVPILDNDFIMTFQTGPVGTNKNKLDQWHKGWHDARVALSEIIKL